MLSLFVVDTGPLITLAAAQSLDYLLYVEGARVIVPDAVFYEATWDATKLGASDILAWVKAHRTHVEIAPTNAFLVFDAALRTNSALRQANLGEQAAVEVIEEPGRLLPGERGVLLCEESAVLRRIVVQDRASIVELSTTDFLHLLEDEQRIQSADAVLDLAGQAGRTVSRSSFLSRHEQEVRSALAALVRPRAG